MRPLLLIEDTFVVAGRGLVLAPDIPFSAKGFRAFTDMVTIALVDGSAHQAEAQFSLTHFKPGGYKLMVALPHERKEHVPIGSCVLASDDVHRKLVDAGA